MDPATAKLLLAVGQKVLQSKLLRRLVVLCLLASFTVLASATMMPMIIAGQIMSASRQVPEYPTTNSCTAGLGAPAGTAALGLSAEQIQGAATIVQISRSLKIPPGGIVVALTTALQESSLINLPSGDRDSRGFFQQRPSSGWGTVQEIMNPTKSVSAFYGVAKHTHNLGLLDIKGWQSMGVGAAAQAVQRSAYPDAYADDEPKARRLLAQLSHTPAGIVSCGSVGAMECPPSGSAAEKGLEPDSLRAIRCVHQRWSKITAWGGVGDRPSNVDDDHQTGRAVDVMIPGYRSAVGKKLGGDIAAWVIANRKELGVKYVIWQARIWSEQRAKEGWRACGTPAASCYSGSDATAAHRDHVHVSTYGNMASSGASVSAKIVLPVKGYTLTAGFGQCASQWAACHTGQDFAVAAGTPIVAVMDGEVTAVGWGGAYGNLTRIKHANGIQTWYAHQLSQGVKVGQQVKAGQQIGRVGYTGNVIPKGPQGAHVHLEVRVNGDPVDPAKWLSAHGVRV